MKKATDFRPRLIGITGSLHLNEQQMVGLLGAQLQVGCYVLASG